MNEESLYFRQLLGGREFAIGHPVAHQLKNFSYLIGDRSSQKAVLVDPAWDVNGLMEIAEKDGMEVDSIVATHCHPDHIGGDLFGYPVEGLAQLVKTKGLKAHINEEEIEGVKRVTGVSDSDLITHSGGEKLILGDLVMEFLHTPGHSPGGQCILVQNRLLTGDTLFIQGCGRVDLPGSDPAVMYRTLTESFTGLPDDTVIYPGHDYGHRPSAPLGEERKTNSYLKVPTLDEWLKLMGRP